MSTDPRVLQRIQHLVALASSDNDNESSVAARKACALMREHRVLPTDVIGVLGSAPQHRTYQPPPQEPIYIYRDAPPRQLGWDEQEYIDRMKELEQEAMLRRSQVFARDREIQATQQKLAQQRANEKVLRAQLARQQRLSAAARSVAKQPLVYSQYVLPPGGKKAL